MKFTFGIATTDTSQRMSGNTNNHVSEIIESIRANNIPSDCYEIIVVGGSNNNYDADDVTHIEFDDFKGNRAYNNELHVLLWTSRRIPMPHGILFLLLGPPYSSKTS